MKSNVTIVNYDWINKLNDLKRFYDTVLKYRSISLLNSLHQVLVVRSQRRQATSVMNIVSKQKPKTTFRVKALRCFILFVQSQGPWKLEEIYNRHHMLASSLFLERRSFQISLSFLLSVHRKHFSLCITASKRNKLRDLIMKSYIYIYIFNIGFLWLEKV